MIAKQFLNRAFSFARYYNIAPREEKAEIMHQFRNAQKAYYQYCGEEQYLIPFMTMDGIIESLDTENGIWVWNSEASAFEMEV